MSNTAEWKLIPFAQNTILRDQMAELLKKQNRYLHQVHAISFINIRSLEGTFSINYKDEVGNKIKAIDDSAEEGGINP